MASIVLNSGGIQSLRQEKRGNSNTLELFAQSGGIEAIK